MTVVDLYTIQIIRDIADEGHIPDVEGSMMAEAEENLTDLLPPGYRARIRRWDDFTDEGGDEDADADV